MKLISTKQLLSTLTFIALLSCNEFLSVNPKGGKIPISTIFQDDATASSAMTGIYLGLYSDNSFAGGATQSVTMLAGLSADELVNLKNDPAFNQFAKNTINASLTNIDTFWQSMYQSIYQANSVLEGLEGTQTVSSVTKKQLTGEALFVRAFCYFYLVNFFGNVPLAVSTDYRTNNSLSRLGTQNVYVQIISDLTTAENLLSDAYIAGDRSRPNKFAAAALLSRVYLYKGDWARAEDKAINVISNTGLYELPQDLNAVFLSSSRETIWCLRPVDGAGFTKEGYFFGVVNGPNTNVFRDDIMAAFETGDVRQTKWITSTTSANTTIYLPYKYKEFKPSVLPDEFSVVIRLAEMYLIRAEARIEQGKLTPAISDINKIRYRAGLPLIKDTNPGIGAADLMAVLERERRIEFLTEWGHRWLDLKRWGTAIDSLSSIKPDISDGDLLYPIPTNELIKNQNLNPQNSGY